MIINDIGQAGRRDAAAGPLLAGVELGGTKIICTLGTGPDDIVASRRIPTGPPEATLAAVEAVLDEWVRGHPVAALGIASFGPLELDVAAFNYGCITKTSKPGWSGTEVAGRLQRRFSLPLGFDTDVNGAALAEGSWGAARDLRSWIYITVGTGVGAGIVVDNRTVRGLGHSEAGHIVVRRPSDERDAGTCPFHGDCVEGLVSGPAIATRTGTSGEHIADDHPIWLSVAQTIAAMIHNLALTTAPQRVLLGGGVIERRPALFPLVRQALVASLADYAHAAAIEADIERFVAPPGLGERAGPAGALALALHALATAGPRKATLVSGALGAG